jgi:hypothetical protein
MRFRKLLRVSLRPNSARAGRDRRGLPQVQKVLPQPLQEQIQEPSEEIIVYFTVY